MRALLLLTVANIKSFTRDRAALFWTLAFPLIFVVLFGLDLLGRQQRADSIGFADLDGSAGLGRSSRPAFGSIDGRHARRRHARTSCSPRCGRATCRAVIVVPAGYGAVGCAAKAAPADADGLHGPEPEPGRRARRGSSSGFVLSARQPGGDRAAAGGRADVPDDPDERPHASSRTWSRRSSGCR